MVFSVLSFSFSTSLLFNFDEHSSRTHTQYIIYSRAPRIPTHACTHTCTRLIPFREPPLPSIVLRTAFYCKNQRNTGRDRNGGTVLPFFTLKLTSFSSTKCKICNVSTICVSFIRSRLHTGWGISPAIPPIHESDPTLLL